MTNDVPSGVSNCYVFKSRLQEYAQKYKLPTPVYETIKEGPSHKSTFQSTVILDGAKYNSLPGFFNRKAAEQSAAEVALRELAKSSELSQCVSQPVHETGLCKNLLQEYAQKMNYAIPMYQCQKIESPGKATHFICTVEIGGIKYTGAATKSKKDAEISAGRTALFAIQSESKNNLVNYNNQLTVLPCEKKTPEAVIPVKETPKTPKAKKAQFKRKTRKGKRKVTKVPEAVIIPPQQPSEECQNIKSEKVDTMLNVEQPSSYMNVCKVEAFESVETNVCKVEAFESVETKASQAIENVETKASQAIESVETKASQAVESVETKASQAIESVETKASQAVESVKTKASQAIESVETKASQAVESVETKASQAIESVETKASQAVESVETKASQAIESVETKASQA